MWKESSMNTTASSIEQNTTQLKWGFNQEKPNMQKKNN